MSGFPIPHPRPRRVEVAGLEGLSFVANPMNGDDAPAFHKEPEHARVQLADVAKFEQPITERLS